MTVFDGLKNRADDFLAFIRERAVVGLAIGFIMGGAVSRAASSFVQDVINPVIGVALGSTKTLAQMTVGVIKIGSFITVLIDLFVLILVVYVIFRVLRLDKLDKKK